MSGQNGLIKTFIKYKKMNIELNKKYKIELSDKERQDLILALQDTFLKIQESDSQKEQLVAPTILQDFKELLEF